MLESIFIAIEILDQIIMIYHLSGVQSFRKTVKKLSYNNH